MRGRPLTPNEHELLSELLVQAQDAAAALRPQLAEARVVSSCTCGCELIGFVSSDLGTPRAMPEATLFPVEGDVVDDIGEVVGGLILFLRDGGLHDLEVFSLANEPLPLPDPAHVRWTVRP